MMMTFRTSDMSLTGGWVRAGVFEDSPEGTNRSQKVEKDQHEAPPW